MTLNFELDKLKSELEKRKPKKVLVQLPEGIKQNAFEIQRVIEELGIKVIFSGETAWGGCSIATYEAESLNCDLLVHFGHAQFIPSKFPILYIEVKDELDLLPILEKSLESIKGYQTLGLSYSIQHRQDIEKVIDFYKNHGKNIILSEKKGFAAYAGHVVGCEYNGLRQIQNEVEAFLILGNNFHSMGAAISVKKPVFLIDVYNDTVSDMSSERDKIIKQRIIAIDKFRHSNRIGLIIEVKPGQKFGAPNMIIDKLKSAGKKVILITMNELTPDKLANFYNIEAFVELGCPRIAIDDFAKYPKTIVTLKEALCAINQKPIEELFEKGFW